MICETTIMGMDCWYLSSWLLWLESVIYNTTEEVAQQKQRKYRKTVKIIIVMHYIMHDTFSWIPLFLGYTIIVIIITGNNGQKNKQLWMWPWFGHHSSNHPMHVCTEYSLTTNRHPLSLSLSLDRLGLKITSHPSHPTIRHPTLPYPLTYYIANNRCKSACN